MSLPGANHAARTAAARISAGVSTACARRIASAISGVGCTLPLDDSSTTRLDQFRTIRGEAAGDAVAERMADHHGGSIAQRLDHRGDVARQIVQRDAIQPASASVHAARFRQNSTIPGGDKMFGEHIEIVAGAAEPWQQHQRRAGAEDAHRDCRLRPLRHERRRTPSCLRDVPIDDGIGLQHALDVAAPQERLSELA